MGQYDLETADDAQITDDDGFGPLTAWTLDELDGSTELDSLRAARPHAYDGA